MNVHTIIELLERERARLDYERKHYMALEQRAVDWVGSSQAQTTYWRRRAEAAELRLSQMVVDG